MNKPKPISVRFATANAPQRHDPFDERLTRDMLHILDLQIIRDLNVVSGISYVHRPADRIACVRPGVEVHERDVAILPGPGETSLYFR